MEGTIMSDRRFEYQFETLFLKPLQSNQIHQPSILVIDAVDECAMKDRGLLLRTLISSVKVIPNLKIFLTSRPEPDISKAIGNTAVIYSMEFRLHGPEYKDNAEDIEIFISHHLSETLSNDQCQRLVSRASGLFIWASTAQQEFENSDEPAEDIFNRLMSVTEAGNLDGLYISILERAASVVGSAELMWRALGVLAAAFAPISISTLEKFVPLRAEKALGRLASVLKISDGTGTILFRHPTFHEFLLRPHSGSHINISMAHSFMTWTCLEIMKSGLRFNICNLSSSYLLNHEISDLGSLVQQYIPESLRYSSYFWAYHLSVTLYDDEIWHKLQEFMDNQFLYWLEVLSMTNSVNAAPQALSLLLDWIRVSVISDESGHRRLIV
jgi:hypothetical protein